MKMKTQTEMQDEMVLVRFSCQERDDTVEIELPGDLCFRELDARLYALGYLIPQKPGYSYLVKNHLCGGRERLSDYMPAGTRRLDIRVFGFPQIMV